MEKSEIQVRRRIVVRLLLLVGFLALLFVGLTSCNFPDLQGLGSSTSPTEIPGAAISPTLQPTATPDAPVFQPKTLILWVPPQFDPFDGSTADNLFLSRLDEFSSSRPKIDIQVRVKEQSGEYGVLETLRTTSSAAPILMPDLVALPRPVMEQAINEGLVLPLDKLSEVMTKNDWFSYALELSQVGDQTVGIPFAGDLLVLAYKDDAEEIPPPDWDSVLQAQKALAFPASDPRGLVTLALYQSLESELINPEGETVLNEESLLEVLTYYQAAQAANVMPYWLTQFETDQQSWQSYQDRQSTMAITWSSIYLRADAPNTSLAALPTKESKPFAYADGWVWCVIPSDPQTEEVTLELAEFITEASFLSTWSLEESTIPTRPSGLDSWGEVSYFSTLQQLLPSAVLIPDLDLLADLGPEIRDAVVAVLKDQTEPAAALADLLERIQVP